MIGAKIIRAGGMWHPARMGHGKVEKTYLVTGEEK